MSLGTYILLGKNDDLIQEIPISQLFLETDTDQNTNIKELYEYVAHIKNIDISDLQIEIQQNFNKIFIK